MNEIAKKVTMKDIADKVGVSKMTISKCFNGGADISVEMKKRIMDVATELGYVYSKNSKKYITIFAPIQFLDKNEEFYSGFYKRLSEEANIRNIVLSLIVVKEQDELDIIEHYNFDSIDGIVILGQLSKKFVYEISKIDIASICVDFQYRNIELDTIISNNFSASYNLTSLLIDNGHTKIGFVGKLNSTSSVTDRYLGYYKALIENDLEINNEFILNEANDYDSADEIKLPTNLPTAFVCNNDHVAYLLIEKLKSIGLEVPKDVSIVGYDDVIYSTLSNPQMTTARVPRKYMASLALDLIERRINNKNAEIRNITVECLIIERKSVSKI